MSRQKMRRAFALAVLVLAAVVLAGCQSGEYFLFYPMETQEDGSEIFYMDGVRYERDWNKEWEEQACYFYDGDQYVWTPAEGIGEQIGVCGEDADKDARLNIYEVAGDGEHMFLYTRPAGFFLAVWKAVFGDRMALCWKRLLRKPLPKRMRIPMSSLPSFFRANHFLRI